jgi:hypothetical protein
MYVRYSTVVILLFIPPSSVSQMPLPDELCSIANIRQQLG